jgi:hypothetical protein
MPRRMKPTSDESGHKAPPTFDLYKKQGGALLRRPWGM